jgi:hypothetical protein
MSTNSRYGFKWSVNEILSLQREFELLGWNIDQIAEKHRRTPNAIMYKLDQERFADYNALYTEYYNLNITAQNEKASQLNLESFHDDSNSDSGDESYAEENDDDEDFEDDDEEEDEDHDELNEDQDELANLSERIDFLEESMSEIRDMIKQIMTKQSAYSVEF